MDLLETKYCPVCKRGSRTPHCRKSSCNWWLCSRCVPSSVRFIVFDSNNRFFQELKKQ